MAFKILKKYSAAFVCLLLIISSSFMCSALGREYTISEIDDMKISLADNMLAVTRDSKDSDEYFSKFGLDRNTTMQNFESGDIYLQGMTEDAAITLTVTMTQTEQSKGIKNYNLLENDKLGEVISNFLDENEYPVCTPDQSKDGQIIWLYFNANVNSSDGQIKAYQAHTVYDGMSVNVILQRNGSNVTKSDYNTFMSIVGSISFGREGFSDVIIPVIIVGCFIVFVILLIIAVIAVRLAKKKRKHSKNDKIISELADKYNLKDRRSKGSYGQPPYEDDDSEEFMYIGSTSGEGVSQSRSSDDKIDYNELEAFTEPYADKGGAESEFIDYDSSADVRLDENEIDKIISDSRNSQRSDQQPSDEDIKIYDNSKPIDTEDSEHGQNFAGESDEGADSQQSQAYTSEDGEQESVDEDDFEQEEFNNDEELVRQQARRNRFYDSDDFFDEAPKIEKGIITEKDLDNAEDYDVISEIEQKAEVVRSDSEEFKEKEKKTSAVETLQTVFAGIKSFGTHLGYFCTNIYRAVKRKRAIAKRRKLEEERRERARLRAEKQRRQKQLERDGSLVQVHSRSDRRPTQRRPQSSQQRRRSAAAKSRRRNHTVNNGRR